MLLKTEIKLNETSDINNLISNLRDRRYIVSKIEHGHLSVEKPFENFKRGFSGILVDRTIIESSQTALKVNYELNTIALLIFITCIISPILIQIFDMNLSKDLRVLLTGSPILIVLGFCINLMEVVFTIRRDIKSSLKKTKGP